MNRKHIILIYKGELTFLLGFVNEQLSVIFKPVDYKLKSTYKIHNYYE